MTDYILSLDKIQQKFIDPETNEQVDLPEAFGLGANPLKKEAPTVEKEVKDLGNVNASTNALSTAYKFDDGNYGEEKYSYQIQPGDTLTKIAREAQMTVKELLRLNQGNPAIKTADLIYAGGNINLSKKVKSKSDIINYDTKPPAILTKEGDVSRIMYELAEKYDLPFELVMAVGQKESGLNPYTVAGDAGTALGLMQVRGLALKDVNEHYGLNITRDEQNPKSKNYDLQKSIESGVAYLALQKEKYGAKTDEEMLAQYNGGPTGMKKKAARDYASSVLGLMKNVKPFDFGAKFTSGDRTPMGEIDSFGVGVDNTVREIKNANLPNVDFSLLESAASYVKGKMPELNVSFTGDDLIGSVQEAVDIDALKLESTTKNTLSKISKTISEYADTPAMLKKKLAEAKHALTNLEYVLTSFKDKFVEGTGEVTDKTLEALGSGASAESGGIGFSGQGEFRPDLSFLNKKESVDEKKKKKKREDVVDVDKAVAAGFPVSIGNLLNRFKSSGKKDEVSSAFFTAIKDKVTQGIADASRKASYTLLPSNFSTLFSDVVLKNMMGLPVQTSYVTEKDFSVSEFNTVKNAAITALKKGKMNIDYADYGTNSSGVKASQLVGKDNTGIYAGVKGGAKFMKDLFTDPKTIMTYTLGGASMRIDENNDVIVTDQYDAEKFKYGSANPGLYGKARNFLQNFLTLEDPSIKGENPNAIRFEINLGNKDDLLKTKEKKKKK